MSDFQFAEENPAPPGAPPKAPPEMNEKTGEVTTPKTPAPPSGAPFALQGEPRVAPTPPAPAKPAMAPIPGPAIPPGLLTTPPTAKAPQTPIPGPPIPKMPPPVATGAAPSAPQPTVPTPQAPSAPRPAPPSVNARAAAAPASSLPAQSAAQTPAAATRPAPIQVPLPVTVPPADAARLDVIEDHIDAPQDAFSRKIWDAGQKGKAILDALEGPASWILRVAVVIGVCALAYILAATFVGGAGVAANPKMALLTKNLALASQALVFSLLAAAIASLLLGYEDNRLGAIVCALGVIFYFAMPILLKKFVGDTTAISVMATNFRHGGYFLVIIGLIKAVFDTGIWVWNLPNRMKSRHASVGVSNQAEAKQRIIAREANMFSPCWKLPFCRESIRKQCPAFLAKKTCWKFGRGCYCDTEMISRIVRGEALELIKAPTQQSRQGKPPCGRCYIYLEHQTYKFRVLSPLALPVAVISTYLVWPLYTKIFSIGDKAFNSIWNSLSFNSSNLTSGSMKSTQEALDKTAQLGARPEDIAYIAQNMFGFLLGFMLLIYLSKFIEWAIYKAKW